MIRLTYKGEIPVKKNRQRISRHGGIYKDPASADFEHQIGWEWRLTRQEPIVGPFKIVTAHFSITAAKDLDGSLTSLLDALQYAGAIENDKHLMHIQDIKKVVKQKGELDSLTIQLEGVE